MARRSGGSDDFRVEVTGSRQLAREIRKLEGGKALRRELRQAGRDAGEPAMKDAKSFVERRHSVSGRLARSVGLKVSDTATYIKIGTPSMEYHGPFVGGWRARGLRPHPVLTVAAAKTKKERRRAYDESMDRLTKKVRRAR